MQSLLEKDDLVIQERNYNIQLILYQYMEQQYPNEKELLHLLSQAPSGLTLNDIKNQVEEKHWRYANWEKFLEDMIIQLDT